MLDLPQHHCYIKSICEYPWTCIQQLHMTYVNTEAHVPCVSNLRNSCDDGESKIQSCLKEQRDAYLSQQHIPSISIVGCHNEDTLA